MNIDKEILNRLDKRAEEYGLSGIETTDVDRVLYLMEKGDTLDDAIDYVISEIIEDLCND